ncbi:MAG: hypothetical protein MJY87_09870 [Fibrobacter sp.]|nr:hypothetical protein [Fibrobacter sp.]
MKSQVYAFLGELQFRCQRIEFQMRHLVDRDASESEIAGKSSGKSGERGNSFAVLKQAFLDMIYGPKVEKNAEVGERNRARRSKSLDAFVSKRNYLSHYFAFEFDLADHDSCRKALTRLKKIQKVIEKTESDLVADRENLQQSRKNLTQILNPSDFLAVLEERVVQFNSNREVALFLSSLGFTDAEILVIVDILLSYEKGSWIVSSSFGQRLSRRIPGFKFDHHQVNSQGKLFEMLASRKYIELISENSGNQKFRVLFKV